MKVRKLLLTALCLAGAAACLTACRTDEPTVHEHSWGGWTVSETPTEAKSGKATRTCANEDCDAAAEDREYTLPALTSSDYTKSADNATCSAGGTVTYTYNKDGVSLNFGVATPVNADAHKYGDYVKTDASGHYKVCANNGEHKTSVEAHNTGGTDGACSVCGYKAPAPAAHVHTAGNWVNTDHEQHYKLCTDADCDNPTEKIEADAHNTSGTDGECSVCGYKAVPAHEHSWGAWTVTEANKPTATQKGKATRTCANDNCDAAAADKEHELPALTSEDYTITGDTATINAEGTAAYAYNKDGINVSFTAATPKIESRIYTVTVKSAEDQPLRDVTVRLGAYTAKTNEQGIASVKAEKKNYTVVLEDAPYTAADRIIYDEQISVSDEDPDTTVWFAKAAPASGGSSETSPKVITEDGVYYITLVAREDPEVAGYYQVRENYIGAKAEVGAASINVQVINDGTVIGVMDAGYDQIENKGASYDIVKERGEQTVFTVTSSDTEITAGYRFTVFFKIKKSLPPESGCMERPVRATEGDNSKTVANGEEKVYFRLDHNTFGNYVLASFEEGVTLYDLGLRVSGEGVQVETGCTLNVPEFGCRYLYATCASEECKINFEKTVLEGMKGRPFTAKTDGSENEVKLDLNAGVLEQWYKIEVSEGGNYVIKTNDMRSYLTAYSDIGGTGFIVKSGMGTSLPLALAANTPVYVKAESHMNLSYTFTCAPATDEDMGTNPQQPMTLVSGEYNVNSTSDAEGKNSYYVFTAEDNTKLTISYPGGGSFMITIFNNAEFDGANGGQLAFVSTWTNAYTRYLLKGETCYIKTNARNASGNAFTFNPVVLENHDYEITFTMPDGTPVSEAMTVKLMKGEEEVASGTLSEGKVTFADVKPENFTLALDGIPSGYGCYGYQLSISLNDDEKTEKTVALTQYVDFSVTVKLPETAENAPVEGAEVTLYNSYQGELTAVPTDSEGKATVSVLPPVNERGQQSYYNVKATLPVDTDKDYFLSGSNTVTASNKDLDITLTRKYELVIKVVLPDGTTPVAGKKVTVSYTSDKTYEDITGDDGVVKIKIPATSTSGWTAEVELGDLSEQYYSGTLSLSSYQNGVEKALKLKEYKNYTLNLKENGTAVGEGIEVTLTKSSVTWTQTTDAAGTVQFSKLETGTYTITLSGNYMTFDKITSSSAGTLDITCYYIENLDKLVNGLTMDDAGLTEDLVTEGKTPVYTAVTSRLTKAFYKFSTAGTYTITVSDINSNGICVDRVFMNGGYANLFTTDNSTVTVNEEDKLSSGQGYTKFTVTLNEGDYIVFKLLNSSKEVSSVYSYIEITQVQE